MRTIEKITEEEMVGVFLKTEINSARFGSEILRILKKNRVGRAVVDNPNIDDEIENECRAALLGEFRGYKRDAEIFAGFPNDVRWERVLLKRDELKEIKYIAWDYWLDITDGSRLALDAAKRIVSGMMDEGEAKGFWAVADAVRQGITLPELILVSACKKDDLVVLEGHVRLTGYLLRPENLPPELPAIVGYSEGIRLWELY